MDAWTLFWVVGVTDFVVKFSVVVVKAFISIVPNCIIAHKYKVLHYRSQQ